MARMARMVVIGRGLGGAGAASVGSPICAVCAICGLHLPERVWIGSRKPGVIVSPGGGGKPENQAPGGDDGRLADRLGFAREARNTARAACALPGNFEVKVQQLGDSRRHPASRNPARNPAWTAGPGPPTIAPSPSPAMPTPRRMVSRTCRMGSVRNAASCP